MFTVTAGPLVPQCRGHRVVPPEDQGRLSPGYSHGTLQPLRVINIAIVLFLIVLALSPSVQLSAHAKRKRFKMVIYQRDLSRRLANQEEAIAMLKTRLGDPLWDIQVTAAAAAAAAVVDIHSFTTVHA